VKFSIAPDVQHEASYILRNETH